jgi:SAM-dependent methyltransferase
VADVLRRVARRGADGLARWRGELVPPRALLVRTSSPSPSEFAAAGRVALDCCRLGGLRPDDRMLDIGSGVGRVAIPLTGFLSPAARYTGVDLWPEGVDWCTRTITPRFPNFVFRHLDLRHHELNPTGGGPITGARLPLDDATVDFVMLGAINHLVADELQALVGEAGRALRPGGTYVGTWFVVDRTTEALLPPAYRAVAGDDAALRGALAAGSLEISGFHPGSWRGDGGALTFQDLVVARKTAG